MVNHKCDPSDDILPGLFSWRAILVFVDGGIIESAVQKLI